jgi:hypothetical protein
MKALEILKEHKYSLDCLIRTDVVSHLLRQTNQAIKELEALENKSCDGCKHHLSENGNYPLNPCSECSRWYSDSWEQK